MLAASLATTGLLMVGSGVFVVIYSSSMLWTALLSRCLTDKQFSTLQWAGIGVLTCGLLLNGFDSQPHTPHTPTGRTVEELSDMQQLETDRNGNIGGAVIGDGYSQVNVGVLVVLLGSALHSYFFVLSERIMYQRILSDAQLCAGVGLAETVLFSAYIAFVCGCFGTHEKLFSSMDDANTSLGYATMLWLSAAVVNSVHAGSFFIILGELGAVESALLKIIQTVCVFAFSAVFFCQYESSQCASPMKFMSMLLVACGLVVYAMGARAGRPSNTKKSPKLPRRNTRTGIELGVSADSLH
ncbi:hypothetical protein SARC_04921 [Sphaeroforma arctica JP610]|uniref:EamA domain-containing protein n=1 Tax=Sphaeroforma arctica JP610 TaxID=667725 RepID=A0A0L0G3K8_9EUKA|nr:hypothetical protein SARC_04921 [Sphaeroforma arctica JP610]KNC82788.1 hypothetical protein SARC_04921 [Sphaeroforma arctica JP610]|eukprot:XP_014156690.1 hypothetical protein SARC_04921 [Sphaeroforma arctica JP610]